MIKLGPDSSLYEDALERWRWCLSKRIDWKAVVQHAAEIVESYDTPVTLRQLWYRLVADRTFPNIQHRYNQLSGYTTDARREGRFPPLTDRGRKVTQPFYFGGVDDASNG